jgi:hypothetical protein
MSTVGCLLASAMWSGRANAYCRTTTDDTFVPTAAQPCATSGHPLYWNTSCIGYSIQSDASKQVTFAQAEATEALAGAAWQGVTCPSDTKACTGTTGQHPDVSFVELAPASCNCVEYNTGGANANIIMFRDAGWFDCKGNAKPEGDVIIALTTVTYDQDTGEIYDADMELNSANDKFTVGDASIQYDLQSVMTHESGHMLGLAHTQPTHTDATMYAQYALGETNKRHPTADDACGVCDIYPPGAGLACNSTPRHGFSALCDAPATASSKSGCSCAVPGAGVAARGLGWVVACAMALGVARHRQRRRARE